MHRSERTPGVKRISMSSRCCRIFRTTPWPGKTHMDSENRMCARRYLIPLVLALVAAGCSDQVGPSSAVLPPVALEVSDSLRVSGNSIPILQQSPTAPPLETYQVSFWAYRGVETTVTVNYQPAPGQ